MSSTVLIHRLTAPLAGLLLTAVPALAASNLLENSPFLPTEGGDHAVAQPAVSLELRSIVKEGGQYQFSLYDGLKKRSTWVGLNEPSKEFLIRAFDAANGTVTVEQQGRTYALSLKEAKIGLLLPSAGGPSTAGAQGPSGGNMPPLPPTQAASRNAELRWLNYQRRQQVAPAANPPPPPVQQDN